MDLLIYDLLVSAAPDLPRAEENAAVVVAIDEHSLQSLGRWPWPRSVHARLVDELRRAGAGAIAYAVLFDAPDAGDKEGDREFARAVADSGRVVLAVAPTAAGDGMTVSTLQPIEPLRQAATALGHVDLEVDPDAVVRRLFLRAGSGGNGWPALSGAVFEFLRPAGRGPPLPSIRMPDQRGSSVTWQRDLPVLLESGRIGAIPWVSAADVLEGGEGQRAVLSGKAVFVGVTAAGAEGALAIAQSAGSTLVPAVVFHAQAYEMLRAGAIAVLLGRTEVVLLSAGLLLMGFLLFRLIEPRWPLAALTVTLLPLGCSAVLLFVSGAWFPPAAATLGLAASSLATFTSSLRFLKAEGFRLSQRTSVTLGSVADGVLTVGPDGEIEQTNPVAANLLGRAEEDLRGQTLDAVFGARSGVSEAFARCMRDGCRTRVEDPVRLAHGGDYVVRIVLGPVLGPRGQPEGAVLALSDITELVAASERLAHQATHDALTGLPNRVLIRDRIEQAIAVQERKGGRVAVLFVDIDRFKRINDGLGHHVGDQVLIQIAKRLKSVCRAEDTVGRWGGDEFIVLLSDPQSADHTDLVASKLLGVVAEPLPVDGMTFNLGASIGISIAPDDSSDPDELLGMADLSMYQVKLRDGGAFSHVSAETNARSRERMEIEIGLRQALVNGNELALHYQPQFDLRTGCLTGMEALIRWYRPGFGLVSPAHFIPIAEESSLILDLGVWVLDKAARQIREWIDKGCDPVTVAVNASARQCVDDGLVAVVAETIARHGIPPHLLEIEITETTAMRDVEHVASLLAKLSEIGVHVALDDFGTGYSSLSHLRRFPFSTLKIDRSFVSGAASGGDDAAISRATIALAHNLGLKVVAEGVETEGQRAFLVKEGCDTAQGYLFGKPAPAGVVRSLLLSRAATG